MGINGRFNAIYTVLPTGGYHELLLNELKVIIKYFCYEKRIFRFFVRAKSISTNRY